MLEIYRAVYPDGHSLVGTGTSNLASVLAARGELVRAEALYREAVTIFERTLSPTHLSTGIGRIRLGRCLLRQERAAEAEPQTRAGFEIVAAQATPWVSWPRSARADLAALRARRSGARVRADGGSRTRGAPARGARAARGRVERGHALRAVPGPRGARRSFLGAILDGAPHAPTRANPANPGDPA